MNADKTRKKRVTSLDLAIIVNELKRMIINSYIDNVYSSGSPNTLLLKLRLPNGEISNLIIDAGKRLNITEYDTIREVKHRVPIFRRFLRNARIFDVRQFRFERIAEVYLIKSGEQLKLIAEVMPRGVVSIVDSEGKVLVSSSDLIVKDRVISAGTKYSYPPGSINPFEYDANYWISLLRNFKGKLGSALVKVLGIPPEVVNEVLESSVRGISTRGITAELVSNIREKILNFMKEVIESPDPVIIKCNDEPVSFHPFKPKRVEPSCKIIHYKTMNEAVDEYFIKIERISRASELLKEYESTVQRLRRLLNQAVSDRDKIKLEIERLKELLSIIEENYVKLEDIWKCVRKTVKIHGWDAISRLCGVNDVNMNEGTFKVRIGNTDIKLSVVEDLKSTYFNLRHRLGKLKRKLNGAEKKIQEIKDELLKEESKVQERKTLKVIHLRSDWFTRYHWIITSNGYLAIGGINQQQNEKIVRKYLEDNDIFMHADIHGGSAFIIKCGGKAPQTTDLLEVATLAASYSKGWKEGIAVMDVFWVWGKQVSKSPPPGQYLPKGSFMIYGKKNYIKGVKLELAIGIEILNNEFYRVVTGPETLISERSITYALLIPGDEPREKLVNQLVKFIKESAENRHRYRIEGDITAVLRNSIPGNSRIVKKVINTS